jgi:hypothetical protein
LLINFSGSGSDLGTGRERESQDGAESVVCSVVVGIRFGMSLVDSDNRCGSTGRPSLGKKWKMEIGPNRLKLV